MTTSLRLLLASAFCAAALAACGGIGEDATIGGTLSGLGSGLSVVLADNGTDNLTLTSNGNFTFATKLATGAAYSVTVATQPVGQLCSVANGSGKVSAIGDVSNVAVTCVASASLTGTVTGLAAGTSVTLSNGSTLLPVAANGAFAFPGVLAVGSSYAVTVAVQPVLHRCTLANASGVIPDSGVVAVTVTCT